VENPYAVSQIDFIRLQRSGAAQISFGIAFERVEVHVGLLQQRVALVSASRPFQMHRASVSEAPGAYLAVKSKASA